MTQDQRVQYWIESSNRDRAAMETLFSNGHYLWALFVGHLVVEKVLKAYHLRFQTTPIPHIHNLLKIADGAGLDLSDAQRTFLDEVTAFNIRARYPDYKYRFYKTANREFTATYLERIREFQSWLSQELTK